MLRPLQRSEFFLSFDCRPYTHRSLARPVVPLSLSVLPLLSVYNTLCSWPLSPVRPVEVYILLLSLFRSCSLPVKSRSQNVVGNPVTQNRVELTIDHDPTAPRHRASTRTPAGTSSLQHRVPMQGWAACLSFRPGRRSLGSRGSRRGCRVGG